MSDHVAIKKPWTIAIIGGGPAGSATALSLLKHLAAIMPSNELASGISINIYDAVNNEHSAQCRVGETIPPAATPALRRLGVFDLLEQGDDHINCCGSLSLWNAESPGYNDFLIDIVGRGYHLNRKVFDQKLLAKACQAGAIHYKGWKLHHVDKDHERHQLGFLLANNLNETEIVNADFVIDATGKSSAFAKRLNIYRNELDKVIFLCAVIKLPKGCNLSSNTLVESVPQGWWYAARLPNDKVIITFCTDQTHIKNNQWRNSTNWLALFSQTTWLKKKLTQAGIQLAVETLNIITESAPSSLLSAVCGDDWLAVGDAASSYDPITSAGITKALQHGEQAGKAIAMLITQDKNDLLQAYQKQVFDDFIQYTTVRNQLYASEKRFIDTGFWQRRLG